jgi:hypothetical protein
MIITDNFVWWHLAKTGGTKTQKLIHKTLDTYKLGGIVFEHGSIDHQKHTNIVPGKHTVDPFLVRYHKLSANPNTSLPSSVHLPDFTKKLIHVIGFRKLPGFLKSHIIHATTIGLYQYKGGENQKLIEIKEVYDWAKQKCSEGKIFLPEYAWDIPFLQNHNKYHTDPKEIESIIEIWTKEKNWIGVDNFLMSYLENMTDPHFLRMEFLLQDFYDFILELYCIEASQILGDIQQVSAPTKHKLVKHKGGFIDFNFTEKETEQMYKNCPQWKKIEDEIYDNKR